MVQYPRVTEPGEALLIVDDDATALLILVDANRVLRSRAIALSPAIRSAVAGAPYVRGRLSRDGVVRLESGAEIEVPKAEKNP